MECLVCIASLPENKTRCLNLCKAHYGVFDFQQGILILVLMPWHQWRSHWGGKGGRVPLLTAKTLPKKKIRKKQEKSGKNRKSREETAKIGKFLSLCPSCQIGLATLLNDIQLLIKYLASFYPWNNSVFIPSKCPSVYQNKDPLARSKMQCLKYINSMVRQWWGTNQICIML